jgi:VPDSG-CTERM motif
MKLIPTKLALFYTALFGVLLALSQNVCALSIREAHESSPLGDKSAYAKNLIGMTIGTANKTNGQYYVRSGNDFKRASQPVFAVHTDTRYAGDLRGIITVPSLGGIPIRSTGVPDGGITAMLLGTALGALGIARRYIMS